MKRVLSTMISYYSLQVDTGGRELNDLKLRVTEIIVATQIIENQKYETR